MANNTRATNNEIKVAINNALALCMAAEGAPSKERFRRTSQFARAFHQQMVELVSEGEILRVEEAKVIMLTCALMLHVSTMAEGDRRVPTQEMLDIVFKDEGGGE